MKFYQILFKTAADARKACIGILGGGGKTTLLHKLGDELAQSHAPVVLSSLTKSGVSASHAVHLYSEFEPEDNREALLKQSPLYVMGDYEHAEKLLGVAEDQLHELYQASELTLFECDGARKKPIKAHQPYDPMIPYFATHTIIVVGADSVGAKVDSKLVHRPELFRELWNVNANYALEPSFIAKILTSQYGYMQKVPASSEVAYLVNKADTHPEQALELARSISRVTNAAVFYGSIEKNLLKKVL